MPTICFIALHQLALRSFPAFERFELGAQLRRAAYSVPANIVYARRSLKERRHFLDISEASLAEVGYSLHVARRLGYIDNGLYVEIERHVKTASAPLVGLTRSASESEPPYLPGTDVYATTAIFHMSPSRTSVN